MFINPLEYTISLVAPYECAICKVENYMLCPACANTNLELPTSRCYLCNKLTQSHRLCNACRHKSCLRRGWWLGNYEEPLKGLVLAMKYQRKRAYAREFGLHLGNVLPYLAGQTMVVPIPTASRRIRQRGYDQAVCIAKAFAHARSLPIRLALQRTTQVDQIGTHRSERFRQMQRSLRVEDPSTLKGASILLVDDVLTTGATLETAARLLRQAGARHVDAAVIARHLIK